MPTTQILILSVIGLMLSLAFLSIMAGPIPSPHEHDARTAGPETGAPPDPASGIRHQASGNPIPDPRSQIPDSPTGLRRVQVLLTIDLDPRTHFPGVIQEDVPRHLVMRAAQGARWMVEGECLGPDPRVSAELLSAKDAKGRQEGNADALPCLRDLSALRGSKTDSTWTDREIAEVMAQHSHTPSLQHSAPNLE
jgi:hypothetical protein